MSIYVYMCNHINIYMFLCIYICDSMYNILISALDKQCMMYIEVCLYAFTYICLYVFYVFTYRCLYVYKKRELKTDLILSVLICCDLIRSFFVDGKGFYVQ
jgi:hypothetical protein